MPTKPPFDPNADFQELPEMGEKPAFDPSAPFEEHKEEPIGMTESALRGLGQGATLGFEDELAGAAKGGYEALTSPDKGLSDLQELYTKYRDIERQKNKAAEEANPKTFMAGNLGGGVATALIPGVGAAKGLAGALKTGAALGGVAGLGNSEAEDLGGAIKDTAGGAVLGAGAGALGHGAGLLAGKVLAPVAEGAEATLNRKAGDAALGAMGATAKDIEKELGGQGALFSDPTNRKGLGEKAREFVNPLTSRETMQKDISKEFGSLLEQKKPLIEEADQALQKLRKNAYHIPDHIRQDLVEGSLDNRIAKIGNDMIDKMNLTEMNEETINTIKSNLQNYAKRVHGSDMDLKKLETLRKSLSDHLSSKPFQTQDKNLAYEDEIMKKVYMAVKDRIEQLADIASDNGVAGQAIKKINQEESKLIDLARINLAKRAKAATGGDKILSQSDYMMGIAPGAAIGGAVAGPIGAAIGSGLGLAGKKATETVIGKTIPEVAQGLGVKTLGKAASTAGKIANTLKSPTIPAEVAGGLRAIAPYSKKSQGGSNVYSASDDQLMQIANTVSGPESELLMQGIQEKDNDKKNKALFVLMQKPNSRKMINEMFDNK